MEMHTGEADPRAAQVECSFDGPPVPLTRSAALPPFPVDAFPGTVSAMVAAVAHGTQTDLAMAGTSALSVLSACAGGHAEVEIRRGWREPLCLYTATVAGPGERKSAVQSAMVRPLLDVEQQLAESGAASRLEAETLQAIALKDADRARGAASSAQGDSKAKAQADAISAVAAAEAIEVPVIPRLVADDVTPEAAASILAEQGGRLAIISAEGGIFDIIAGRYSKIPNLDLWLKGHSGDPIKVDRKGRPPEYIRRPALTLGLMIQPTVLTEIARTPSFRGRGFLARILYSLPVSKVGSRAIAPAAVPPGVEQSYEVLTRDLAAGLSGWSGDPAVLMLTESAAESVKELEARIEPSLGEGGELAALADWGAKYVGAVVRIAGLLHLAEHGAHSGVRTPIAAATIEAATRIGAYFKACARNAFDEMQTDEATTDACYLRDKLEGLGDEVSVRDMHRASRGRFKTRADLDPPLHRLVEHDYLQPLPAPPEVRTSGRPPSPRYRVNNLWTERPQRTQSPM